MEFSESIKEIVKEKRQYKENNQKAYTLLRQHTEEPLRTKLEGMSDWARVSADQDGVGMLRMIRSVLHKNDESNVGMMSLVNANCASHDTSVEKRESKCLPQAAPSSR